VSQYPTVVELLAMIFGVVAELALVENDLSYSACRVLQLEVRNEAQVKALV